MRCWQTLFLAFRKQGEEREALGLDFIIPLILPAGGASDEMIRINTFINFEQLANGGKPFSNC